MVIANRSWICTTSAFGVVPQRGSQWYSADPWAKTHQITMDKCINRSPFAVQEKFMSTNAAYSTINLSSALIEWWAQRHFSCQWIHSFQIEQPNGNYSLDDIPIYSFYIGVSKCVTTCPILCWNGLHCYVAFEHLMSSYLHPLNYPFSIFQYENITNTLAPPHTVQKKPLSTR